MDTVQLDQLRQLATVYSPLTVMSNGIQPNAGSTGEESDTMALDGGKPSAFKCRIRANKAWLRVRSNSRPF